MMQDPHMTAAWHQLFWQLNLPVDINDHQNMHFTDLFPTLEAHLHGPEPGALLGLLILTVGIIFPREILSQWLLGSQPTLEGSPPPFHSVFIKIEGFSAGSYTAIVVLRWLLYLRKSLACEAYVQVEAVAGAIALPPDWLDYNYPSNALSIVHVVKDRLCQ